MVYDPAWDMPRENWAQQGSFEAGEVPPDSDPDAGTMVCLPPINEVWLPFVLGCLDQMRNPSAWIVADDTAMSAVLSRVDRLKQMFGGRADCAMSYSLRFIEGCLLQFSVDDGATWADVSGWATGFPLCVPPQTELRLTDGCELQDSIDGGATWTAVTGWDANFGPCVQSATPIIGLPPNPGDQAPSQLACSIASYLSNQIILAAMEAGVTSITDDLSLLAFGASILNIIPEFILVRLGYDALGIIYADIAEGTLSDFEAAIADGSLWLAVSCAIYNAILTPGYVDPSNFSAIVYAVGHVSYAHSDVITAIVDYMNSLGPIGLAQLSQRAGLETGADCSSCGWCHDFFFTADDGGWAATPSEDALPAAYYVPTVGWTQYHPPTGGTQCRIQLTFDVNGDPQEFSVYVTTSAPNNSYCSVRGSLLGATVFQLFAPSGAVGAQYFGSNPSEVCDTIYIEWNTNGGADTITVTRAHLEGSGTDPVTGHACGG